MLEKVVHLPLNIRDDYGKELSQQYDIGAYLPLFLLLNSEGDLILRWDGYSSADKFIRSLSFGLNDLTPIKVREERLSGTPTKKDINILARYYEDTQNYRKAIELLRRMKTLSPAAATNYDMSIFENFANAAWHKKMPFDSAVVAADILFDAPGTRQNDILKATRMITNAARANNQTEQVKKYLLEGIKRTKGKSDEDSRKNYYLFLAEYSLYIMHDTVKAIEMRQRGFGPDWDKQTKNLYPFAKYCYDRNINMDNAYTILQLVPDRVKDGTYKAKVFWLLSQFAESKNERSEAVRYIELAIEQDPENDYYNDEYERLTDS